MKQVTVDQIEKFVDEAVDELKAEFHELLDKVAN